MLIPLIHYANLWLTYILTKKLYLVSNMFAISKLFKSKFGHTECNFSDGLLVRLFNNAASTTDVIHEMMIMNGSERRTWKEMVIVSFKAPSWFCLASGKP